MCESIRRSADVFGKLIEPTDINYSKSIFVIYCSEWNFDTWFTNVQSWLWSRNGLCHLTTTNCNFKIKYLYKCRRTSLRSQKKIKKIHTHWFPSILEYLLMEYLPLNYHSFHCLVIRLQYQRWRNSLVLWQLDHCYRWALALWIPHRSMADLS